MEDRLAALSASVNLAAQQRHFVVLYADLGLLLHELRTRITSRTSILSQVRGLDPVVRSMLQDLTAQGGLTPSGPAQLAAADALSVRLLLADMLQTVRGLIFPAYLLHSSHALEHISSLVTPAINAMYSDIASVQTCLEQVLMLLDTDTRN